MKRFTKASLCTAAAALGLVTSGGTVASAGEIVKNLGGGWQVTIFDPDTADVVTDFVNDDILVVEKAAEFIDIDPDTEQPEPINLLFTQIAPDAQTVTRIILTDEIILNSTGQNWTSFRNILIDSGQVMFNQAASATFSIAPFTTRTYNGSSTEVEFAGGVVPAGGVWTPGLDSGGLVIDIDLDAPTPVSFTLKELPVPEPTSALLVLGGALAMIRCRWA